jgi:hypothetical protein
VRCPDAGAANSVRATSYSRWTDRSVHLCSKTPHACFHARGSSVRCPLAKAFIQCTTSPGELVICGLAPPPDGASLPHADARVLALIQRDSHRSLTPHRPHVSISEVLPSAFASCGIPPDTPSGWHLLPFNGRARIRLCRSQLPCFASVGRCFPPGFCGSACRSVGSAAGALSCAFWLQRLSLLRWVMVTMAQIHLRLRCP